MAGRGFRHNSAWLFPLMELFLGKRKLAVSNAANAPKPLIFTLFLLVLKSALYQITWLNISHGVQG